MTTQKSNKAEESQKSPASSPMDPSTSSGAGVSHDGSSAGAPGSGSREPSEKDRPINISTADDVDIDQSSPEEDATEQKP